MKLDNFSLHSWIYLSAPAVVNIAFNVIKWRTKTSHRSKANVVKTSLNKGWRIDEMGQLSRTEKYFLRLTSWLPAWYLHRLYRLLSAEEWTNVEFRRDLGCKTPFFFLFSFVPHEIQNEMLNDDKQKWSERTRGPALPGWHIDVFSEKVSHSKEENDSVGSAERNRGFIQ